MPRSADVFSGIVCLKYYQSSKLARILYGKVEPTRKKILDGHVDQGFIQKWGEGYGLPPIFFLKNHY